MDNTQEALHKVALAVVEKLRDDPSTLSVILTGPQALGQASKDNKLYIAVITSKDDGVIEHHFLNEGWDEITTPIEMGKFPLEVVRYLLEHGYSDMVSYKTLEALRCGRVLWEKNAVGTEAVTGAEKYIPTKAFLGELLHGTVSDLDDATALLKSGDYTNAAIVAREAATKAVGMVIADNPKTDASSFLQAAKAVLPTEQFERYLEVSGLQGIDAASAAQQAGRVREFVTYALEQIGVNPEHVLGGPDKERKR